MWPKVPLRAVLALSGSGTWGQEPDGSEDVYPVLRSTNIQDSRLTFNDFALRKVPEAIAEKYALRSGDILVTTSSGSSQLLGKNAIVDSLPTRWRRCLFSNFTWRLRPHSSLVHPKFLYFYLNSATARVELQRIQSTTSGLRNLNTTLYLDQPVPFVPLSEQRRIVEILDEADRLRRLRAEADAKAGRILPALFIKMFGDPLSLAKDPRAKPLSSFQVDLQNGFACGEKDVEDGLPHLRMNNIADSGELDLTLLRRVPRDFDTERYRLRLGDVLFMSTNSEDKVGKACVFDLDASEAYSFSNHLIRIRIEDPDLAPSYLATLFHSLWRVRYFCGVAKRWVNQSTVSKEALGRVPIVAFPKGLQSVFSVAYERYRSLKAQRAAARDALERMFETLLRLAFSAELTASWREAHMKELLQEMEQQAKVLEATKA
jgi:type I restriction enzyme S subunit